MEEAPLTDAEIGRRVQTLRDGMGLSQGELATRLQAAGVNWSQGTLSKVENGDRPIRLAEAPAVAAVLEAALNDLVTAPVDPLSLAVQRAVAQLLNADAALAQSRADLTVSRRLMSFWEGLQRAAKGDTVTLPEVSRSFLDRALRLKQSDAAAVLGYLGLPEAGYEVARFYDPLDPGGFFLDRLPQLVPTLHLTEEAP